MTLKLIFVTILLGVLLYNFVTSIISIRHDKKPLPEEVRGIYDADRYQKYLSQRRERMALSSVERLVPFAIDCLVLFSPFYQIIEGLFSGNVYATAVFAPCIVVLAGTVLTLPFKYYETFVIDEKHGLNKATKKEFAKDSLVDLVSGLVMMAVLMLFVAFIGQWAGGVVSGGIGLFKAVLIVAVIAVAAFFIIMLVNGISLLNLRMTYKFSDLPEGELRDKIMALTEGSRKKVKRITVYNESAKSTGKNAFLLKIFGYREFGIADNFLNENDERELLAVLAHEAGHLKYKKKPADYGALALIALLCAFGVWALCNADAVFAFSAYVRDSFGLKTTNYSLLLTAATQFIAPIAFAAKVFKNWSDRRQEYFADANAVQCGLGKELKDTFVRMSSDELINVNPSPIIEFLEYDHPGMYNRIRAINIGLARMSAPSSDISDGILEQA